MSYQLKLPAVMEPFREELLRTKQGFVRLKSEPSRAMKPWESKVGGQPYLPKEMNWPCMDDGTALFFLCQINFADMPPMEPFPSEGIVQFFIHDDDLYGMDFDDGEVQDTFRVLWHPHVVQNEAILQGGMPHLRDYDDLLPHHPDESYPLSFSLEEEVVGITDYRFYEAFGQDFFRQFGASEWDVMDDFGKCVRPQGHKIGGYAYFTQDDPRTKEDHKILLLQLDSDERMDLMWGDMGVGHFFIREKDLRARDFSKVLYDWDCL